ncbi:MAG: hypothetical protein ACK5AO_04505 [bacterium]|jgi:hypothetical protein
MKKNKLSILFSLSHSAQLSADFSRMLKARGSFHQNEVVAPLIESLDEEKIEFSVRLDNENQKAVHLTWQKLLAYYAVYNIYNHN